MTAKRGVSPASWNQSLPNKLLSCLYIQRKTGKFCDVVLNVGDVELCVHSCVLAAFSPYFNDTVMSPSSASSKLLQNKMDIDDNVLKEILEDWSLRNPLHLIFPAQEVGYTGLKMDCSDCAAKVLDFMYLGKIQIQDEHVEHIQLLSSLLDVPELILVCDKFNAKHNLPRKHKIEVESKFTIKKAKEDKGHRSSPRSVLNVPMFSQDGSFKKVGNSCDSEVDVGLPNNKSVDDTEHASLKRLDSGLDNSVNDGVSEEVNSDLNLVRPTSEKKCDQPLAGRKEDCARSSDKISCSICDLKFSSAILLRQHRETHRGKLHTCYACRFSSHKAFALIKHLLEAEHQETICSLCFFEGDSSEKLKEHLKLHNHPKPFFCTICYIRFHNRTSLNAHAPKHSTEMPYACTLCDRAFKWKQSLNSHMIVHTPEKKYLCPECGFSTAYQSTFKAHTLVHTSNLFTCAHAGCNFKTRRKQNLISHIEIHNKEKSYQCEICGQSYSQAKNLRRHAIRHSAEADDYMERCSLCLYRTTRLDKLKIHFKKHHPESDISVLDVEGKKRRRKKLLSARAESIKISASSVDKTLEAAKGTDQLKVIDNKELCSNLNTEQNSECQSKKFNNPVPSTNVLHNHVQPTEEVSEDKKTFILMEPIRSQVPKFVTFSNRLTFKTSTINVQSSPFDENALILLDNPEQYSVFDNWPTPLLLKTENSENIEVETNSRNLFDDVNSSNSVQLQTAKCSNLQLVEKNDHLSCINPKLLFVENNQPNMPAELCDANFFISEDKCTETIGEQNVCSVDNFTSSINNVSSLQMQQLTTIVDGFNSDEIQQSLLTCIDESSDVGSLANEQFQRLNVKEVPLNVLNNNVIEQLFDDSGGSVELGVVKELDLNEDSTNTLDILSKEVPDLVDSEETLGVVLGNNKEKMLLCHEMISDREADQQNKPAEESSCVLKVSKECNEVLESFESFESILNSL